MFAHLKPSFNFETEKAQQKAHVYHRIQQAHSIASELSNSTRHEVDQKCR